MKKEQNTRKGLKLRLELSPEQELRCSHILNEQRKLHNFIRADIQERGRSVWIEACLKHPNWNKSWDPMNTNLEEIDPEMNKEIKDKAAEQEVFWTWVGSRKSKITGKKYKIYDPLYRGKIPSYLEVVKRMQERFEQLPADTAEHIKNRYQITGIKEYNLGSILPRHIRYLDSYKNKDKSGKVFKAWYRFISYKDEQSFRIQLNNKKKIVKKDLYNKHITLPCLGTVKISEDLSRNWERYTEVEWCGEAIISRRASGEWYVSLQAKVPDVEPAPKTGKCVGLDMVHKGNVFFARSDEVEQEIPDFSELEEKINKKKSKTQKRRRKALIRQEICRKNAEEGKFLTKAEIGKAVSKELNRSKNQNKMHKSCSKLHDRIKNIKDGFFKKVAYDLVHEFDVICVEDINLPGMQRTRGKKINSRSWRMFLNILEYMCNKYGKTLVKVDRYFPSTQLCSACGSKTGPKGLRNLNIRVWECSNCGAKHDRDFNAAKNVLKEGLDILGGVKEFNIS